MTKEIAATAAKLNTLLVKPQTQPQTQVCMSGFVSYGPCWSIIYWYKVDSVSA